MYYRSVPLETLFDVPNHPPTPPDSQGIEFTYLTTRLQSTTSEIQEAVLNYNQQRA